MVRAGWDFLVCWLVGTLSWLVVWVYFRFWGCCNGVSALAFLLLVMLVWLRTFVGFVD